MITARRLSLVVLGTTAIAAPLAIAATFTDPKGDAKSRLDLKSLVTGGAEGSLELTVKAHKTFGNAILGERPKKQWLCVYLWKNTSDPTGDSDFLPCARARNGKLVAQIWSKAADGYVKVGAKVARIDGRTLRFTIPTSIFEGATGFYFWGASLDGAQRTFDAVPNAGPMLAAMPG